LGGNGDVLVFREHVPGVTYVTADLTGKPDDCFADFELMICHRSVENKWGGNIISQLAAYAIDHPISGGETMDIDSATPADSSIKAFLFDTYGTFSMFGREFGLRLCLGITKAELHFAHEHGAGKLVEVIKRRHVYPYTDLDRKTALEIA
jgi:Suppressor of fused protein (SUFU)